MQIRANGGFDVVVAVYTWSESTSRITRTVRCQNDEAGSEDVLIPRVSARTNYTIQVGGANGAGGPLNLLFDYFPDTDGDGILDDAPDKCRKQPGIERFGGCPPELRSTPRVHLPVVGGGLRITALEIDDVPKGARAEVRCGRKVTPEGDAAGDAEGRGCAGRTIGTGSSIQIRVTLGRTGKGQYRYGAVGKYFRWPVSSRAGSASARRAACSPARASPRSADEARGRPGARWSRRSRRPRRARPRPGRRSSTSRTSGRRTVGPTPPVRAPARGA